MINISNRLKTVASFILDDNLTIEAIDVGCDHALLDIYLIENKKDLKLTASDINTNPLKKAIQNITKYSLLDKITVIKSDGISSITEEMDTVIISGMGADTIIDILTKDKTKLENIKKIVISSNNKYPSIRVNLSSLGYKIEKEKIVFEDGKFYIIMKFIKGFSKYSKKQLYFGPYLLKNKDEDFYRYFDHLKKEKEQIIKKIPNIYKEKRKKINMEIKILTEESKESI